MTDLMDGFTERSQRWNGGVITLVNGVAGLKNGIWTWSSFGGAHRSSLTDSASPEHIGRTFFWFGNRGFDQEWFQARLNEAIIAAGPRYTPEAHVDLPIAQDLELFARTEVSIERLKSCAIPLRRALGSVRSAGRTVKEAGQPVRVNEIIQTSDAILDSLAELKHSPNVELPVARVLQAIAETESSIGRVRDEIRTLESQQEMERNDARDRFSPPTHLERLEGWISQLTLALGDARDVLESADSLANKSILIVNGPGGVGKTHLLCDFAERRTAEGSPTLLLMGHGFRSTDDPWTQTLRQLGMGTATREEFVAALETAAQVANKRALVIVDAINEGKGVEFWPHELESFVHLLEESPWIAIVLSIRTSYVDAIISKEVRNRAATVVHGGFDSLEYDAARKYFSFYGLEFPSTPILHPEFQNPLFLKTLCEGLKRNGQTQIPKGFHGISAAFVLYITAINDNLAEITSLDYDSSDNLVYLAVKGIAEHMAETGDRWLPRSMARDLVNDLLPARPYSRSLYAALVSEGILTEDLDWRSDNSQDQVAYISYERLADHIVVDYLLRTHLDPDNPAAAFAEKGGLAYIRRKEYFLPTGVMEALCIQIPERTGKELARLAPELMDIPYFGFAFLDSITWRSLDAFREDTRDVLSELGEKGQLGRDEVLDCLLTVSTVPGHRFNANYLDERLRRDPMPDRDSWWSTYLHSAWQAGAWGSKGAMYRLVDWASGLNSQDEPENEVIDLAAITLTWMFSTPNRFLRDKATKALVSLLTGRLDSAGRLVERFSDVDDPYVAERVYAVAYGVAMRSHNTESVAALASVVYEKVFASGSPPIHILLRDYARGVIERAIHLGANIDVDERLIRPPYKSQWPNIPSEEEVKQHFSSLDGGAYDGGDLEWSRNRIWYSVMGGPSGDFGNYVIGRTANLSWLSIPLAESLWQSPKERKRVLLAALSEVERTAYEEYENSRKKVSSLVVFISGGQEGENVASTHAIDFEQSQQDFDIAHQHLIATLTDEHRLELGSLWESEKAGPPHLDMGLIQRYVLWRVFDLGWTIERFGEFDRFSIRVTGRQATKQERTGKKYQWIAYHEILAYLSDHCQFFDENRDEERGRNYEGAWQLDVRDIDPSCTLRDTLGGTGWGPHVPAWWGDALYEEWSEELSHQDWIADKIGIPAVEGFIQVVNPDDGSHWLSLGGLCIWRQPHPAHVDPYRTERRELWLMWTAYIIGADDVEAFLDRAENDDSKARAMAEPPQFGPVAMFLGEYGWSSAFRSFSDSYKKETGSYRASGAEIRIDARPSIADYVAETGGYDGSLDESYIVRLPDAEMLKQLGADWSGQPGEFLDDSGIKAVFDPTTSENGPNSVLIREDLLRKYLEENNLAICWIVSGEKWTVGGDPGGTNRGILKIDGGYSLTEVGLQGVIESQVVTFAGI